MDFVSSGLSGTGNPQGCLQVCRPTMWFIIAVLKFDIEGLYHDKRKLTNY